MIDVGAMMAVFRAELRLTLRLVRFWVFLVVALLITAAAFAFYSLLHYFLSTQMPFLGTIAPRYIVSGIANNFILVFGLGLVFLAFDIRARDVRERMHEVLDARPIGNAEIVLGRAFAQVLVAWLPMMLALVAAWGIGSIFGEEILPGSIVGLGVVMGLPSFVFIVGLTYVVTLLVRNRLVAAVAVVGTLVGLVAALFFMTIRVVPLVDLNGGYMLEFPSEIVRLIVDGEGILHRVAVTIAGLGLLALAVALYPRLDDGKKTLRAGIGILLLSVGLAGVWAVVAGRMAQHEVESRWLATHEAAGPAAGLDIVSIDADASVDPGRELGVRASIELANRSGSPISPIVLTLNPGFLVEDASMGGAPVGVEQDSGLVTLDATLGPGESGTLELAWSGAPDMAFAYLDAPINVFDIAIRDAGMFLLGYRPGYFTPDAVVLPPGLHWLPSAGAAFARRDGSAPRRDLYRLALDVAIPGGWLAAAPGRRSGEGGQFRFAPEAPVPGAALVAGPYVSRATEIEGVLFEVLFIEEHVKVLDDLEPAREILLDQVGEMLRDARESGLGYPYAAFTVVEVPSTLRGWGGEWRMDTTLAPPGMFLMKENALPTARFDVFVKRYDAGEEGEELDKALAGAVRKYFLNDITGTNILAGATRNLVRYQAAAEGPGAEMLDLAVERLAASLTTDRTEYFSVHVFDRDLQRTMQSSAFAAARGGREDGYAEAVLQTRTDNDESWDALLASSVTELDPWEDPSRALDVLVLKTDAMARSLRAELGRGGSAVLLGRLREAHRGGAYDRDDVVAAAGENGDVVAAMLGQWLDTPDLAGFVVDSARHERIADREDGTPRYQLELVIRNDEPVPGTLQVAYAVGSTNDDRSTERTDAVRIGGREAARVGVISSREFREVTVEPFLSLNRGAFEVRLPPIAAGEIARAEPFEGIEPAPWTMAKEGEIVIDDLDPGFRVEQSESESGLRVGARRGTGEADDTGRMPSVVFGRPPKAWARASADSAYGRYRHTAAVITEPDESARAFFGATLDAPGRYRVDVYVPGGIVLGTQRDLSRGAWIVDVGGAGSASVQAEGTEQGWAVAGEFDLPAGEFEVALSAGEGATFLVADAVRLVPVVRGSDEAGSR